MYNIGREILFICNVIRISQLTVYLYAKNILFRVVIKPVQKQFIKKHFSGTHGYMAPEVIEKGSYDSSADWFSLGCMLMKLLNG